MPGIENLDWLETFVAVVEHGSFSDAAKFLHRSQPRVSAHIADLERALGGTVLDRRYRPVVLTDLGTEFLPFARKILRAVAEGHDAVARLTGDVRGRVVIGCHPSVSAGFMPDVIADVHAAHPEIRVELTEHTTPDIISGLEAGRFHIAVHSMVNDPAGEGIETVELWVEPYAAVVAEGHPLASAPLPLRPSALRDHALIAVARPGSGIDPDTRGALTAWGLDEHIAWQSEMPLTVAHLAKRGLGVGILNSLAAQISQVAGVVALPIHSEDYGRRTGASRDRHRAPSAATDAVFDAMRRAAMPDGTTAPSR